MAGYACGVIKRLSAGLHRYGVSDEVTASVMEGGEAITEKSPRPARRAWLSEAMCKMDRLIDPVTRQAVRESCACCLGGKRLAISKAIARENATLDDRIKAANEARFVFGHSVTKESDGSVMVRFAPDGPQPHTCPCLPVTDNPMPVTYCYCCAGHAKHHLQTALGRKLHVTVIHTALSTAGRKTCAFRFNLAD